jgi:hypothetical protein
MGCLRVASGISRFLINNATFSLRAICLLNTRSMDPPSPELEPGSTDPQQAGTIDLVYFFTGIEPARHGSGIFPKQTPSPKVCKLCAYVCIYLINSIFLQQAARNMAMISLRSPMVYQPTTSMHHLPQKRFSEGISTNPTLRSMIQL